MRMPEEFCAIKITATHAHNMTPRPAAASAFESQKISGIALLLQALTKLCKSVYPWDSVSEMQFIKEPLLQGLCYSSYACPEAIQTNNMDYGTHGCMGKTLC